jgi:hypothetical protein
VETVTAQQGYQCDTAKNNGDCGPFDLERFVFDVELFQEIPRIQFSQHSDSV